MGVCRSGDMNYQDYPYAVASLGFSNLCKQCKGSLDEHSHAYASESVSQHSYNKHVSAESLGILMLAKRFGALTICSSISKQEYVVKMNGKPMLILGLQELKNHIHTRYPYYNSCYPNPKHAILGHKFAVRACCASAALAQAVLGLRA